MTFDEAFEGGDPPCWAHLFDEEPSAGSACDGGIVDLVALSRTPTARGAVWTHESDDLDINLLVLATDGGVDAHVNAEVDVLLVGIAGEGRVEVAGRAHSLRAGQALVVPKGTRRAMRTVSAPFAYLSCHRRRGGLRPSATKR